jgi:hypothetical protein
MAGGILLAMTTAVPMAWIPGLCLGMAVCGLTAVLAVLKHTERSARYPYSVVYRIILRGLAIIATIVVLGTVVVIICLIYYAVRAMHA